MPQPFPEGIHSQMTHVQGPLVVVIAQWQTVDAFHKALTTPAEYRIAPSASDEDVIPLLSGAHAIITETFTSAMGVAADSLLLIQTPGAGLNTIDFDAVPEQTTVCNVYGHERGIAEYVFITMGMLNRDFPGMDQRLREGDWRDHVGPPLPELQGKTMAIVGLGRIGAEVARWGKFLDMRVIAATRNPDSERSRSAPVDRLTGMDALPELLAEADFVVLALPLSAETTGLIGASELAAMKPSAYLINPARGGVVDEEALYMALRDRSIAGAAIDVWYRYPGPDGKGQPSKFPFHELPNVVMTPHIAGATEPTYTYRWAEINKNLGRIHIGEPFTNVVKPCRMS
jgi:phosphoglycerate dehydrogenase-like enzyme